MRINEDNAGNSSPSNQYFYEVTDNIVNPKRLTIKQIQNCVGFENISDEKAVEIIQGLYNLSIITYKIFN